MMKNALLLTCVKFLIPRTKQIASKMFDFPLPFKPVIALNSQSKSFMTVLWRKDLKPSITNDFINIFTQCRYTVKQLIHLQLLTEHTSNTTHLTLPYC